MNGRPPAIHAIYRDCPGTDVVVVFGDGSVYRFAGALGEWLVVRAALVKGHQWNLNRRIRRATHVGAPGERLEAVPEGLLVLYQEPPYEVFGPAPQCPPPFPFFVYLDVVTYAFWLTVATYAVRGFFRVNGPPFWAYQANNGGAGGYVSRFDDLPDLVLSAQGLGDYAWRGATDEIFTTFTLFQTPLGGPGAPLVATFSAVA